MDFGIGNRPIGENDLVEVYLDPDDPQDGAHGYTESRAWGGWYVRLLDGSLHWYGDYELVLKEKTDERGEYA